MTRLACTAFLAAAFAFAAPSFAADEAPLPKATITGVLNAAEDAGYPMYAITITPAGGAAAQFLMNNEEAKVTGQIGDLVGKNVTADYETRPSNTVIDLTADGKSIAYTGDERPAPDPTAKTITGILSGGKVPTASDLPDQLTVTAKDGAKVTFDWYVDDTVAKYDGKEVTLSYLAETTTDITKIGPAK